MGPRAAAVRFRDANPRVGCFRVTLFGSLAATGRGHLTDRAISDALSPAEVTIDWKPGVSLPYHPNGMRFEALDEQRAVVSVWTAYSVGGGMVVGEEEAGAPMQRETVYELESMTAILTWCSEHGTALWEYVYQREGGEIEEFLTRIWAVMQGAVKRGLEAEGVLPGGLRLQRKAAAYYARSRVSGGFTGQISKVFAYALAVAEENAAGAEVVTAPTCGSAGVLPGVLYQLWMEHEISERRIVAALATAGLIGNLVKTNASISGAEVGCQGEIGTACSMAAGAAAQLFGATPAQVEYAAEMAMEHHLGLTCDPVAGLVQIPCIERNAMAASRAIACATYALFSDGQHKISFDDVVETMRQTGRDLASPYRETSSGGLARIRRSEPED
jgi:L-serine dehydratase